MSQLDELLSINKMLVEDQPQYRRDSGSFPKDVVNQRKLMRSLMNVRYPRMIPQKLLEAQDVYLSKEREAKGVVHVSELVASPKDDRLILWQGDITRLDADAIVNAANAQMLGCFVPCHGCIDNAIHSAAGMELREECAKIMRAQGHEEPTGQAKITKGYNLPAKHVIHTVGPIIYGQVTGEDRALLASCYRSCLALAKENKLTSIAFCCISTGEFHFPNREAAEIAVRTVTEFLNQHPDGSIKKVVFNVFKDLDKEFYEKLLSDENV
ncbi:MAG: protein-ADP-ribose hydrolase [Oribacterium sp.]|nr:protein-ADP-ribose hydrolase [Oribacterium sp.]